MLQDSCVYVSEGDEPSCMTQEVRKARKVFTCTECGDPILRGSKYEDVQGKWDGKWLTFKTCRVCLQIRNDFFVHGFNFGSMWEEMAEHWEADAALLK